LKNLVMTNVSVKDVINHVNAELGGFTVNCDYDFKYSKFTINNATGYDVLKKIQEEIIMEEFELKQGRGTVKFSINEKNIIHIYGLANKYCVVLTVLRSRSNCLIGRLFYY